MPDLKKRLVRAYHDYGIFRRRSDILYPVIDEGYDWLLVKVLGKAVYVFKWVFEDDEKR